MARKTGNHRFDLPALELGCMQALWRLGEGTVHEVRSNVLVDRPLAYTTILTVMDRLARKGVVGREKRGKAYLYRPLIGEDSVRRQAVERLLASHFQGSRERLLEYLSSSGSASASPRPDAPERPVPENIDPSLL